MTYQSITINVLLPLFLRGHGIINGRIAFTE